MKTVKFIERPFFMHGGRVYNSIPDKIEICKGKVIYTFILSSEETIILHPHHVFETKKELLKTKSYDIRS